MVKPLIFKTREEWLEARQGRIGGSDAGCILGLNPWKSNTQLFAEKMGKAEPADLSDNPLVQYGIAAEPHIRALFALDHPELSVWYEENNMFLNGEYPWAHYSADGLLEDQSTGEEGILEIKTATIQSAAASEKWKDGRIPDSYLAQILHGMAVIG
ncbi:MAG: YqaJ viral recombinase family protein, partial [Lachnospiraceae bacterium]|nr:YqaJ viral recombinase family protein [Lachnospiraceae bacterium]